jgi:hypothetical protein
MPARHVDADGCLRAGLIFRLQLQGDEGWQICLLSVAVKRQPFTHEIGVDAVAHRNAGHRCGSLPERVSDSRPICSRPPCGIASSAWKTDYLALEIAALVG